MEIISGTTNFQLDGGYAVTIGKFDGIHRGHRELIDRILAKKRCGMKTAVFTFDVSPLSFFSGNLVPGLTTNEEKRRIFEFLGIDTLIEYPLNEETAKIQPEQFITDILCKQMNMKYIAVGCDISFGYKGLGNAGLLKLMSTQNGKSCYDSKINNTEAPSSESKGSESNKIYEIDIVDKLIVDNKEVSSTLIRKVVSDGNMEKAAALIGVPYAISGIVSEGRKLGRTIGFPTLNLEVPPDKLMPPNGVYFTEVSALNRHYNGITNVGTKPTITASSAVFVETHIMNFNEDIYGKRITVKLLHFKRPERKFPSVEALKSQISSDVNDAKRYFFT